MLFAEEPYQQYGHDDEYHQVAQTDGNGKPLGQVGEEIGLLHRLFIFDCKSTKKWREKH